MKAILLVDDSASMLMSIKATLEMNVYRVEPAAGWLVKPGASADLVAAIKQVLPGA